MPALTVVTAVYRPRPEWLVALGESLAALVLPDGWELRWAVQEDGTDPVADSVVERFGFSDYHAVGAHHGVAVARNLTLTRVGGDVVANLDQDDLAAPGLAGALEVFDAHPEVAWVAGQVDDLLPDGSRQRFATKLLGPVRAGEAPAHWEYDQALPFHTIGTCARVPHWRALGGWGAQLTMSDDTFGVMGVSQLWPGWVLDETVALWRRHPNQNSSASSHADNRCLAWRQISLHLDAIAQVLGTVPASQPPRSP